MKLLHDYVRLIVFSIGFFTGIQVPALVDQYSKRVDAKLLESTQILSGFQDTAERYFGGSIEKLIEHYLHSDDKVFNQDASNIRFVVERVSHLHAEQLALQNNALLSAFHVMFRYDPTILQETINNFTYAIILDPYALVWGSSGGLFFGLLLESGCIYMPIYLVRWIRRTRTVRY